MILFNQNKIVKSVQTVKLGTCWNNGNWNPSGSEILSSLTYFSNLHRTPRDDLFCTERKGSKVATDLHILTSEHHWTLEDTSPTYFKEIQYMFFSLYKYIWNALLLRITTTTILPLFLISPRKLIGWSKFRITNSGNSLHWRAFFPKTIADKSQSIFF